MLVVSSAQRPRGAEVEFATSGFSGKAEVIWTKKTNQDEVLLGLKFTSMGTADHAGLHRLLKRPELAI